MTPTTVDLRANIDQVYDQSTTAACFPHAVVNALDAMYDHAGQSQRFSRSHLWYWGRFHMGLVGRNVGVSPDAMRKAISEKHCHRF